MSNEIDDSNEWESATGGSGKTWNPTKDEAGDPREEATDDDFLDGYYMGVRNNVGQNNSNVYSIRTQEGELRDVWGTKTLNDEMESVRLGQYIRMRWLGKQLTKAGAQVSPKQRTSLHSFHNYKVLINKSIAAIDVSKPTASGAGTSASAASNTQAATAKTNGGPGIQKNNTIAESDDLPF